MQPMSTLSYQQFEHQFAMQLETLKDHEVSNFLRVVEPDFSELDWSRNDEKKKAMVAVMARYFFEKQLLEDLQHQYNNALKSKDISEKTSITFANATNEKVQALNDKTSSHNLSEIWQQIQTIVKQLGSHYDRIVKLNTQLNTLKNEQVKINQEIAELSNENIDQANLEAAANAATAEVHEQQEKANNQEKAAVVASASEAQQVQNTAPVSESKQVNSNTAADLIPINNPGIYTKPTKRSDYQPYIPKEQTLAKKKAKQHDIFASLIKAEKEINAEINEINHLFKELHFRSKMVISFGLVFGVEFTSNKINFAEFVNAPIHSNFARK